MTRLSMKLQELVDFLQSPHLEFSDDELSKRLRDSLGIHGIQTTLDHPKSPYAVLVLSQPF
ncbi:MAG TPA: hypothetical protein VI874_00515, partial [Candidatus Norongarragalinales archaeon]|nr:hypothetical protein [Candidatus Norongarragalinales archaeon]